MIAIVKEKQTDFSDAASALVQMGQHDLALEYLEQAVQSREVNLAYIRKDPDLEPLFNDLRFLDLLQRAGIKPPASG
jgi:hypothetical protein